MISVTYFGISNFQIAWNNVSILIDPCFSANPMTGVEFNQPRCDLLLVTHGGSDHLGDSVEIMKVNPSAIAYAPADVATHLIRNGIDSKRIFRMVPGAIRRHGEIEVKAVQAVHVSFIRSEDDVYLTGVPLGFIINLRGTKIYHTGDTCLFSDLKMIGELYSPDIMCVPIGMFPGAVTEMEPWEAARATYWVMPRQCIPMHFDPITQADNPAIFREELAKLTRKSVV